ncbi:MAG TPA: hypothetical protein VNJ31_08040 [Methyloceanibacter sp.]|nr:hypothetical protein [Methyloceanibacter sp.]
MRRKIVGVAAAAAMTFAGPAFAMDPTEEIQEEEQPGSEIELDIGPGGTKIERKSGAPVFAPGQVPMEAGGGAKLELPDDPDMPPVQDPVDEELPGEGPEDLSGPGDEDPLPY